MTLGIVVLAVVVVWIVIGSVASATSPNDFTPPPGTSAEDARRIDCQGCFALENWWNSLSGWEKLMNGPWYYVSKALCALKGC